VRRLAYLSFATALLFVLGCAEGSPSATGTDTAGGVDAGNPGGDGDGDTGGDGDGDTSGDGDGDTSGDGDGDTSGDGDGDTSGDGDGDTGGDGDGDGDLGLEEPGEFGVFFNSLLVINVSDERTVFARLCAPSTNGGTTIAPGPFPLIIASPGASFGADVYASYCEHMASWGFIVVSQNLIGNVVIPPSAHGPLAADTSAVIDWALNQALFRGSIARDKIGLAGHSLGGKVSFLTAADDPRVGAVVGWDPVDTNGPGIGPGDADYTSATPERMGQLNAKVAVIGETLNPFCAPLQQNFRQYFEHAPSPALEIEVLDAGHEAWTDETEDCRLCTPCGTTPKDTVRALTRRLNVAWFRRHLLGDTAMDAALRFSSGPGTDKVVVRTK